MLTPGLNINSDGAGRAFVAIRGVGVTLVDSVQPGVGLFLDGIYQPNTVVSEQPAGRRPAGRGAARAAGHAVRQEHAGRRDQRDHPPAGQRVRGQASSPAMPGPTTPGSLGASLSGPIIKDGCRSASPTRIAQQDGFIRNTCSAGPEPAQHRFAQRHDPGRAGQRRRADGQRLLRLGRRRHRALCRSSRPPRLRATCRSTRSTTNITTIAASTRSSRSRSAESTDADADRRL